MQSKRRVGAGMAVVVSALLVGGCNFSKTGAIAPNAPDVVSVIATATGGATTVTLDPSTVDLLTADGIALKPTGAASESGGAVSFPITSGYAEVHQDRNVQPGWIQGSLDHATSGLDVVSGAKVVHLTDFVVDPGDSMLYATVDGKPDVPFLSLDGTNVSDSVDDAGQLVLTGTVASLTSTAATALNTAFGVQDVPADATFGQVEVIIASGAPLPQGAQNNVAVADGAPTSRAIENYAGLTGATYNASKDHVTAIPRLTGTATTLTLEPQVASALTSAGLTVAPTGSATASGASVTFPITGGMVAIHSNKGFQPGYVVGSVLHQGSGITISGGGATLTLGDFVVNPGTSVLTGTVNGGTPGTPLFFLDGSKLQVTPTASGATLDGTVAQLTQESAKALNTTFGVSTFQPGMPLGTVHLVATGS